jgi:diguanylate cyclase (GGDEF)-like protein/PAS domain S-box-containing protein
MANLLQNESQVGSGECAARGHTHRRRTLRVLFVHRDADAIDSCLQELEKGQFTVIHDFVLNLGQCAVQLRSQSYDVIIVEYPSPSCKDLQVLQHLRQTAENLPVIFLTTGVVAQSIGELTAQGVFDSVEQEHIAKLPMTVRRALNDMKLREELEEARKALKHSQSLYRALVDNPAYGIYRCNAEGELLDVNQALVTMLGYTSKDQVLAANEGSAIIPNLCIALPFVGRFPAKRIEPIEIEWKRKDGTTLKARLSGRGVYDDVGNFDGYEVIAVDVTEQRTLEDQLRHQASSDALTGLANHRRFFEVLQGEICRSKRTGREFSLVLLDLDGLKQVNDQFGHLAGDRALCRLGQMLKDCCRSIDTAARHGGDEFALVLPETGIADATLVARRICELLERDAEEPALSVSVGIASYPREADSIGTLLYAADVALYAMKDKRPRGAHDDSGRSARIVRDQSPRPSSHLDPQRPVSSKAPKKPRRVA